MIKNKSSRGFGVVGVLVLVIAIGVIGFAGWTVYRAQTKPAVSTKTITESSDTAQTKSATLSKTYKDPVGHFTVNYPEGWTLKSKSDTSDPTTASSTATISSPSGTVLNLGSDWGGRGGMCEPEPSEKPFTVGNTCPSVEFLSSEALPISSVYYSSVVGQSDGGSSNVYKKSKIVLITKHYMDVDGSRYIVGLTDSNPSEELVLNEPVMGLVNSDSFFAAYSSSGEFYPYIYAYASGPDAAFLQSDDVATIKDILRSMTVNLSS